MDNQLLVNSSAGSSSFSGKKNLLFIFTDEQRCDTLKAYGNNQIDTPNLDKLAGTSAVFERAYVSQPVCTPSRSTIMSGLYPHTNKCVTNNVALEGEFPVLTECADFSEYKKAYYGKWHLGDEIFCQHGFDEWISIEDMYWRHYSKHRDMKRTSSYTMWLKDKGFVPASSNESDVSYFNRDETARMNEEFSKPSFLAEQAEKFLSENKENPFVLYVNFLEPHMPFTGPRDDQYGVDDIQLPDNYQAPFCENIPGYLERLRNANQHLKFFNSEEADEDVEWKNLICRYWGLVSLVDSAVGRIMDALRENGLEENTIIVYTSDHGDMMGSHGLITKGYQYEESIRVPLLMKVPGEDWTNRRISEPVGQVDLVPTLLDLLEKEKPGHLQGHSWADFLLNDQPLDEEDVFVEWNKFEGRETSDLDSNIRTVITKDLWKLNWYDNDISELYDLNNDPGEMENHYGKPEFDEIVEKLTGKIKKWQKRTGDKLALPELNKS